MPRVVEGRTKVIGRGSGCRMSGRVVGGSAIRRGRETNEFERRERKGGWCTNSTGGLCKFTRHGWGLGLLLWREEAAQRRARGGLIRRKREIVYLRDSNRPLENRGVSGFSGGTVPSNSKARQLQDPLVVGQRGSPL